MKIRTTFVLKSTIEPIIAVTLASPLVSPRLASIQAALSAGAHFTLPGQEAQKGTFLLIKQRMATGPGELE